MVISAMRVVIGPYRQSETFVYKFRGDNYVQL